MPTCSYLNRSLELLPGAQEVVSLSNVHSSLRITNICFGVEIQDSNRRNLVILSYSSPPTHKKKSETRKAVLCSLTVRKVRNSDSTTIMDLLPITSQTEQVTVDIFLPHRVDYCLELQGNR